MKRIHTLARQRVAVTRLRLTWLLVLVLPIVVAACNNNGGSGY